jgi:hypothetical protein
MYLITIYVRGQYQHVPLGDCKCTLLRNVYRKSVLYSLSFQIKHKYNFGLFEECDEFIFFKVFFFYLKIYKNNIFNFNLK